MVYVRCDTINLLRLISLESASFIFRHSCHVRRHHHHHYVRHSQGCQIGREIWPNLATLVIVIAVCVGETGRRSVVSQCHLAVKIGTAASLVSAVVAFTVDQFPFLTCNPFSVLVLAYTTYLILANSSSLDKEC